MAGKNIELVLAGQVWRGGGGEGGRVMCTVYGSTFDEEKLT